MKPKPTTALVLATTQAMVHVRRLRARRKSRLFGPGLGSLRHIYDMMGPQEKAALFDMAVDFFASLFRPEPDPEDLS